MKRRAFLAASAALFAAPALASTRPISLRGTLDAGDFGLAPDAGKDQTALLQRLLNRASREGKPVFLPAGRYLVSGITLPAQTRLMALAGSARLVHSGRATTMLVGDDCEAVHIDGVVLDGAGRGFADDFDALLRLRRCGAIDLRDCTFMASGAMGVSLERCGGTVQGCMFERADGLAALYSVQANGLTLRDNVVRDCANGGLLVHRWEPGADDTIVTGNRIARIGATRGGTGQYGNGVNLYRAHGVLVANNHISDCAFSAVRCNSASNASISGNTCLRSGETGIYAEFAFEGAVIANNIVDGATIGVSIANFLEGGRLAICSGNLIRNLTTRGPYPAEVAGFGIGIFAEADTLVTNNVVEGAPQYGIGMGWGPYLRNVMTTDNVLRGCREGVSVSVVEGAKAAVIRDNLISEGTGRAVVGRRWRERVTGDMAVEGVGAFDHLTVDGNVVA
ncbi:MAG: TIGR03808 family TAT-translocated repetitive protein [Pseudomonadota bacterium]